MKELIKVVALASLVFIGSTGNAKYLGVKGELWPVEEKSLLKLMQAKAMRLNSDEMASKWQGRARDYADRPSALRFKRGRQSKVHHYTPIASLRDNVTDINDNIIVPGGVSINVLTLLPDYKPELVIFNSDDRAQLQWAIHKSKKLTSNVRFILTGGSIRAAEKALKGPVYFDQKGVICNKFGITQMPAFVKREKMHLVIEEPLIEESGYEI